jgi:OmpA-OmpF porin, OOP family
MTPMTTTSSLKTLMLASAALTAMFALSGCKGMAKDSATDKLSNGRTQTDKTINTDYEGYKAQQSAIKTINDTGKHPVKSYSLAKAQCWLDVSLHEYSRNDRSRFPQLAMTESVKITDYLGQGGAVAGADNPANQTPLVNNAAKLREDLWAQAASYKGQEGFKCAERQVACAEVELVHAGNEHNQQGWRHAKPYVQIAEDLLGEAKAAIEACKPAPTVVPVAPPPPAAPAPAPAPAPVKTIEKITLGASALFRFDKRNTGDLLPEGKAQMDDLANKINTVYANVESINLVGYTDRLGTDSYNNKLSIDRANTVKAYLQSKGVTAPMTTSGRGEADPIVDCPGPKIVALTQCLQPNRRVEITITGTKR